MGYVLDGAGIDSPECRELRLKSYQNVEQASNVPGILLFDAKDAYIAHDGPENQYKPYLMIMGRPAGIQADLPYHVSTLRYQSPRDKKLMGYRYDFSRENLAELSKKGLFDKGFGPSRLARTSRYELPCEISYVAFPPDAEPNSYASVEEQAAFRTMNPPVVFASLHAASLHCDDATSGYQIHDYFEPAKEPTKQITDKRYELPTAAKVLGTEFEGTFFVAEPVAVGAPVISPMPEPDPEYDELLDGGYEVPGDKQSEELAPDELSGQDVEYDELMDDDFDVSSEGSVEPQEPRQIDGGVETRVIAETGQERAVAAAGAVVEVPADIPREPVAIPDEDVALRAAKDDQRRKNNRQMSAAVEAVPEKPARTPGPRPVSRGHDLSGLDVSSSSSDDLGPEFI